jgi:putative heme d1 biosynthesis radical SAM protein NirJ2
MSWNTTQACNIHCLHCYRDAGDFWRNELTTEEGKQLLDDAAACGFRIFIFSGGEPLMRADLPELIRHARQVGLRPVIGTNGTLLTEENVKMLKEAGLAAAGISVDSLSPEKHDWFRQAPGAWELTRQGIRNCREAGLPFQIHTTVMDWNEAETVDITDAAIEWGAMAHHVFFLVPTGRGEGIADRSLPAQKQEELLEKILEKQKTVSIELKPTCAPQFMRIAAEKSMPLRFGKGCIAGTAYCVVLPNGDLQPCPYFPLKAGNVREIRFATQWKESPLFAELRKGDLGGACGTCGYQGICGGCRARAWHASNGDFMAEDPHCTFSGN